MPHLATNREVTSQYAIFYAIIRHVSSLTWAETIVLANQASVHPTTLYNWTHGEVMTPRIDTLSRVAAAMGYDICFKRRKKPQLRRVK